MTRSRQINAPRRPWTDADIAVLKARYPHEVARTIAVDLGRPLHSVYRQAYLLELAKSAEFTAADRARANALLASVGVAHRFAPGVPSTTKGSRGLCGQHPNSRATQFKPGHVANNHAAIGDERHSKEGYLQRKMTATGYPPRDWVAVHRLLWTEAHGPIPDGFVVAFKDGDKKNITLDNLELVSKAAMLDRTRVQLLPPALKEVVYLKGSIKRRIHNHERKQQQRSA